MSANCIRCPLSREASHPSSIAYTAMFRADAKSIRTAKAVSRTISTESIRYQLGAKTGSPTVTNSCLLHCHGAAARNSVFLSKNELAY